MSNLPKTALDWHSSAGWIDQENVDIGKYMAGIAKIDLPDYDLAEKLDEWHTHGVVIFKNVVDVDLVKKVEEDLKYIFQNNEQYGFTINEKYDVSNKLLSQLSKQKILELNFRLVDLYQKSYNASLLSMIPEVNSFLTHLFSEAPALLQSLTFNKGTEQGIHQDFSFVYERHAEFAKLAACWIPLEDIHEDSGPLEYYCGSHNPDKIGFFDWGNGAINRYDLNGSDEQINEYTDYLKRRTKELGMEPSIFLPQRGDVLIWHGALIHGGSVIKDHLRTRKSHVCHYTSVSSHINQTKNLLNGGYIFDVPEHHNVRDYAKQPNTNAVYDASLYTRAKNKFSRILDNL